MVNTCHNGKGGQHGQRGRHLGGGGEGGLLHKKVRRGLSTVSTTDVRGGGGRTSRNQWQTTIFQHESIRLFVLYISILIYIYIYIYIHMCVYELLCFCLFGHVVYAFSPGLYISHVGKPNIGNAMFQIPLAHLHVFQTSFSRFMATVLPNCSVS